MNNFGKVPLFLYLCLNLTQLSIDELLKPCPLIGSTFWSILILLTMILYTLNQARGPGAYFYKIIEGNYALEDHDDLLYVDFCI